MKWKKPMMTKLLKSANFLCIGIAIVASFSIDNVNSQPQQESKDCSYHFSWEDSKPFTFIERGIIKGYDIDLLKWIMDDLNCEIKFSYSKWAETLDKIKAGKADFSNQASLTKERQDFAAFSLPYREIIGVLYVRKKAGKKYKNKNLESLLKEGFKLGIGRNIYYGEYINRLNQHQDFKQNIVLLASENELIESLENSNIDGFFATPFLMDNESMSNPTFDRFEEYPVEIVIGDLRFIFSKKTVSQEFVKRFNQSLRKIQRSQSYLAHRYWSKVKKIAVANYSLE